MQYDLFSHFARRMPRDLIRAVGVWIVAWASVVGATHAVIPASERTALLDFFISTNGASWTNNTGWNGAVGTECAWFGVTCTAGDANVSEIRLNTNNLSGSFPATFTQLTQLSAFTAGSNQLTGGLPTLANLTRLSVFVVDRNQLSGTIGSLNNLLSLNFFAVNSNRLTGSVPAISGLNSLRFFYVDNNQLTGSIPLLPPFIIQATFANNAFTGNLPPLTGLTQLNGFLAQNNQLTGMLPSLAGLTSLNNIDVSNNRLTGVVPPVPVPNGLAAGNSYLCPNAFTITADAAWDTATGRFPWSSDCTLNYTVTPIPSANGTIFPDTPQLVGSIIPIDFRLFPDPGYGVVVGGTCKGALNQRAGNFSYTVQPGRPSCTVAPTFSNARFNVNITVNGIGAVTPVGMQSVLYGIFVSVVATTNNPATPPIATTTCGNGAIRIDGGGQFTTESPVTADCAINVTFGPAFTVTPIGSVNGYFDREDPFVVAQNAQATLIVTPNPGYRINTVTGCGGTLAGNFYTTGPITQDCAVSATFVLLSEASNAAQPVPTFTPKSLAVLIALLLLASFVQFRFTRSSSRADGSNHR